MCLDHTAAAVDSSGAMMCGGWRRCRSYTMCLNHTAIPVDSSVAMLGGGVAWVEALQSLGVRATLRAEPERWRRRRRRQRQRGTVTRRGGR